MAAFQSSISRLRLGALILTALVAALLTVSLAPPSWSRTASRVVGIAAAIVNDVRIRPASLARYAPAKLRQRVAIADRIRTGPQSRLQVALLDKTQLTVGANAQLTIDDFVYDPNGGSVTVSAAKGAMRFFSGSTKARRQVRTPAATIGIRGTVFDTAVGELAVEIARHERAIPQDTRHDPRTATLAVLRGPGPNRQGGLKQGAIDVEAAGRTVSLEQPLLAAYVPYAGAPPIGPFPISLPGLDLLNDFILPPPQRDFAPASEGLPFPDDRHERPGPWTSQGMPPPTGGGSGPGGGSGIPGGMGGMMPSPGGMGGMPSPGGMGGYPSGTPMPSEPAQVPQAVGTPTSEPTAGASPTMRYPSSQSTTPVPTEPVPQSQPRTEGQALVPQAQPKTESHAQTATAPARTRSPNQDQSTGNQLQTLFAPSDQPAQPPANDAAQPVKDQQAPPSGMQQPTY